MLNLLSCNHVLDVKNRTAAVLEIACLRTPAYVKRAERIVPVVPPIVFSCLQIDPAGFAANSLTDSSNVVEQGWEWVQYRCIYHLTSKVLSAGLNASLRKIDQVALEVLASEFIQSYKRGEFDRERLEIQEIHQLLEEVGMSEDLINEIMAARRR